MGGQVCACRQHARDSEPSGDLNHLMQDTRQLQLHSQLPQSWREMNSFVLVPSIASRKKKKHSSLVIKVSQLKK